METKIGHRYVCREIRQLINAWGGVRLKGDNDEEVDDNSALCQASLAFFDVMVQRIQLIHIVTLPDEGVIPRNFLNSSSASASCDPAVRRPGSSQETVLFEQDRIETNAAVVVSPVDHLPFHVNQVGTGVLVEASSVYPW